MHVADPVANIPLPEAAIAKRIRGQDAHDYCQRVTKVVEEIQQGQYQKIILSRRITLQEPVDLLSSYHLGRRNNMPASSFIAKVSDDHFKGFSPETVVEVSRTCEVSPQILA